jgi:hypothetical protein
MLRQVLAGALGIGPEGSYTYPAENSYARHTPKFEMDGLRKPFVSRIVHMPS